MRKILLTGASLLILTSSGIALAINDNSSQMPTIQPVKVSQPVTTPPLETATTQSTVPTPNASASLVAEPTAVPPASIVTPKTVDELKAEATQNIIANGDNEAQVGCFIAIIQEHDGWTLTEDEMLVHLTNIKTVFISICAAQYALHPYFIQHISPDFF